VSKAVTASPCPKVRFLAQAPIYVINLESSTHPTRSLGTATGFRSLCKTAASADLQRLRYQPRNEERRIQEVEFFNELEHKG
jgi:hypothetical protein